MEEMNHASFPTLFQLIEDEWTDFNIRQDIISHLKKLLDEFDGHILKYNWVRMPFNYDINDLHEDFTIFIR